MKNLIFLAVLFSFGPAMATTSAYCKISTATQLATAQLELRDDGAGDDTSRGESEFELGNGKYKMIVITDVRTSGSQINCGILGELYFLNAGQPVFLGSQRAQKACSTPGPMPPISLDEIINYDLESIALAFDCSVTYNFRQAE